MTDKANRDRAIDAASARLVAGGRPIVAAVVVLAALVAFGRLGLVEAGLAGVAVALACMLPPKRRFPTSRDERAEKSSTGADQVEAILSGLPDPALVLDQRGAISAFNAHAVSALGEIRKGEPISFAMRVPEVLEAVRSADAASAPQTVLYVERVPVERWREAHVATVRLGEDGATAVVVVLRDLTEQRRSERMRGDFVANASHELRTPLASLLGFIETLQGSAKNDPVARDKFLEIMRTQANRMSRLIDDLLSLSRIELKAHVRPRDAVDIASLARGVADALSPLARERGVEIAIAETPGAIMVRGDRDELIRVAENLFENAIKYGQSGKRVDVSIEDGEGDVKLVVRDYGPGVAPEHLPRLTERFYRVDVTDSRDKGGTGLGLALVKHILQRHGGRLTIDSAPGEGATFTAAMRRYNAKAALDGRRDLRRAS